MVVLEGGYRLGGVFGRRYDIDPSGERFLLIKGTGAPGSDSSSLSSTPQDVSGRPPRGRQNPILSKRCRKQAIGARKMGLRTVGTKV